MARRIRLPTPIRIRRRADSLWRSRRFAATGSRLESTPDSRKQAVRSRVTPSRGNTPASRIRLEIWLPQIDERILTGNNEAIKTIRKARIIERPHTRAMKGTWGSTTWLCIVEWAEDNSLEPNWVIAGRGIHLLLRDKWILWVISRSIDLKQRSAAPRQRIFLSLSAMARRAGDWRVLSCAVPAGWRRSCGPRGGRLRPTGPVRSGGPECPAAGTLACG